MTLLIDVDLKKTLDLGVYFSVDYGRWGDSKTKRQTAQKTKRCRQMDKVKKRQEMIYPPISIYSLRTTKLIDVFGNDTNKVLRARI